MTGVRQAAHLAYVIADRLAHPSVVDAAVAAHPWWRQSLAHGVPGIALLHIELATAELRPWQRAHDWLAYAAHGPATSGGDSFLFHGAPALAHALACAAEQLPGSYQRALATLDEAIAADVRRRVDTAHARIDQGRLATFEEYDILRGLTGIGAYLLRRDPGGKEVRAIAEYLVRLTEPVNHEGEVLPGWMTPMAPSGHPNADFPGGHANAGMAHGTAGPLALLALTALAGITVNGQREAIGQVCAWLDSWRADTGTGPTWPYWVTRAELRTGALDDTARPVRPSWCYGTAGLARAQQLAALATGDTDRRTMAEHTLADALADPAQRAAIADPSLCHGHAGLAHVALRVVTDATDEAAVRLRAFLPGLLDAVQPADTAPSTVADALLAPGGPGLGLLDGAAGIALACLAPSSNAPPWSAWDTCLLIT